MSFDLTVVIVALAVVTGTIVFAGLRFLREDNMVNLPFGEDDDIPEQDELDDDEDDDDDEEYDDEEYDEDDDDDDGYIRNDDYEHLYRLGQKRAVEIVSVPETILAAVVKEPSTFPDTITRMARFDHVAQRDYERELLRDARPDLYLPNKEWVQLQREEISATKIRHDMDRAKWRKEVGLPIAA